LIQGFRTYVVRKVEGVEKRRFFPEALAMRLPRIRFTIRRMLVAVAATLILSGCPNGHDRPLGHADVTFDVSPSGEELVFNAAGEGGRDLDRLDLASRKVTRIAATPDYEVDPEYSPDGMSVVYAAGKPGDRADHIFLRSLDGKSMKRLTKEDANDASPSFSSDGSLIVFTRDKTYNWGGLASNWDAGGVICVMKSDGTGLQQITKDGSMAINPHFSRDGKRILFWGDGGLATVSADGSAPPTPLGGLAGTDAVYSPDDRSVAFVHGRYAGDQRIFTEGADGSGLKKLDPSVVPGPDLPGGGRSHPVFTPDGKRIIFLLEFWPDGPTGSAKESLWVMDSDGKRATEIADYGLIDDPLRWKPRRPVSAQKP
jgi:Tol biopolymer transport system component